MQIRPVQPTDAEEWLRMRVALWPDDPEKEAKEVADFFAGKRLVLVEAAFVCPRSDGGLCGLAEVHIKAEAPGCVTDRIGYLEGWYVDPDMRGQGIGRALVAVAEEWARAKGCTEMASDTSPRNPLSPAAHAALGYLTVAWHFRKEL